MASEEAILKLAALISTDGCLTGDPKRLKIRFTNKAESLHKIFVELIKEVAGDDVRIITFMNKDGVKTTEINSNRLTRFFRWLMTKNKLLPVHILEKSDERILREVLKLMFSCDGSPVFTLKFDKHKKIWRKVRRIKFASKNKMLLFQVAGMLKRLRLTPQISEGEIIIEKKRDIGKFSKEIRFFEGVPMSKNSKWFGLSKNEVLDLIISSF